MLYLVDASIYVFRAWFSLPDSMTDPAGRPINALYGFARFLGELLATEAPGSIGVAFDTSLTASFRNEIYPPYKANRPLPPPELEYQFALCREWCRLMGVAEFASPRYEADDIIGTLAAWSRVQQIPVAVVSADKDLAQLLREGDVMLDPARERRLGYRDIAPEYGVPPEQIADLLALMGDAVDNIPGVPGIGPKTAITLLGAFADLGELYANLDRIADLQLRGAARVQRLLSEHKEQAFLARELATIAEDADVEADASVLRRRRPDLEGLGKFYDALGIGDVLRKQATSLASAITDEIPTARRPSAPTTPTTLPLFRPVSADGPADWYAIADAVREDGGPALFPEDVTPVSGGCIHGTFRVRGDQGWYFVKRNDADQLPVLRAGTQGLRALHDADVVRVPTPLRCGVAGEAAYLVMEWIDFGKLQKSGARQLGKSLAALHRQKCDRFGWHEPNYLGATVQRNSWCTDWVEFFAECRLGPQLRLAYDNGYRGQLHEDGERLLAQLDAFFEGYTPVPSLLHGDLWAGNCSADKQGRPVLFDPAVHYGDRECDLAMMALFGGFDRRCFEAYEELAPLEDGAPMRQPLYQAYHVLNHLNLFGGGYLAHAQRLLQDCLRA
ncbi:MAG: fructosamine kinase family protein [Pseudomonadota bacterium]